MRYAISTLAFLFSYHSFAEDLYDGSLVIKSLKKSGVLSSGVKNLEARIIITKNQRTILQLPVSLNDVSIGLSAGVKFSGDSFATYKISGMTGNTQISDFFETYKGTSRGITFAVPGPCCITINKESLSLENSKGLHIEGSANTTGWMIDLSKTFMKIQLLNKYNERKVLNDLSLSQLSELEFQSSDKAKSLVSLECKDANDSISYFISVNSYQEIDVKTFNSNLLKEFFTYKTNALKPYIQNSILSLYPEQVNGKVLGNRFDIDLNSEILMEKTDFFGRHIKYSGKVIDSNSKTELTCLSKESLKNHQGQFENYRQSLWSK